MLLYIAHVILGAALVLIVNRIVDYALKKPVKDKQKRKTVGLAMGAIVGIMLSVASGFDVVYSMGVYVPGGVLAVFVLNARDKRAAKKVDQESAT